MRRLAVGGAEPQLGMTWASLVEIPPEAQVWFQRHRCDVTYESLVSKFDGRNSVSMHLRPPALAVLEMCALGRVDEPLFLVRER